APLLDHVAADIGGKTEEHGMPEGQQSDVADEQIERARKQSKAQDVHQKYGVDGERRREREQKQRGEGRHPPISGACNRLSYLGVPNSPCGRSISTTAMMMKMTVFDASG